MQVQILRQLTGDFMSVDPARLFLRNVSIRTANGVSRPQPTDSADLLARCRIRPEIGGVYRPEDAVETPGLLEASLSTGRPVLNPGRRG